LVTSAALSCGQTGGEPPTGDKGKVQPPPVVQPAPYGNAGGCGCNSGCDSGCGSNWFGRCKEKLGGLFHRGGDCGCNSGCNSCGSTPSCFSGGGHSWMSHSSGGCGCNSGCDSGCGGGFLGRCKEKLGGLFHRGGCGCDSGCNSCGGGSVFGVPPPGGEKIPPPGGDPGKKMPGGPGGEPPSKQVQLIPGQPAPIQTPAPNLETPPAAPAIVPPAPIQERPF
jgi:hypothetical protein